MERLLGTITGLVLLVLLAGACGEDEMVGTEAGDGTVVPTTEAGEVARAMTVLPDVVEAGSLVELTFDEDAFRGVAWRLEANGVDVRGDQPDVAGGPFLLVAAASAHTCADCPRWYPPGEGGYVDVGISGPGPDLVRIPEVAAPGPWRLCSENAGDPPYCADLTVVERSATAADEADPQAMAISPQVVGPGQLAELRFPSERLRGAAWRLTPEGAELDGPETFVMFAAHSPDEQPSTRPLSEVGGVGDVGYEGPGPDVVRLPDEIAPGRWQVCDLFDDPDAECVEVLVTEDASG